MAGLTLRRNENKRFPLLNSDLKRQGSEPMKIERINENQIRCTLSSFDLSVRDLNLGELAYGSEKAKKLFREMIQKASNEVGFEAVRSPTKVLCLSLQR